MEARIDRRRFLTASLITLAGIGFGGSLGSSQALAKAPVKLPGLPYGRTELEPYLSKRKIDFHYGKHHAGYVGKLNKALAGHDLEGLPLEEIIRRSGARENLRGIFNNAAQIYNHTFYWLSMRPQGGGRPKGDLAKRIDGDFGGYQDFRKAFIKAAGSVFGSGWLWLVEEDGKLRLLKTSNAGNPLTRGLKPLLTIDLWEHAYYLDYQNRRGDYVKAFIDHLVNWDFAASNL